LARLPLGAVAKQLSIKVSRISTNYPHATIPHAGMRMLAEPQQALIEPAIGASISPLTGNSTGV